MYPVRILGIAPYLGLERIMQQLAAQRPEIQLITRIGNLRNWQDALNSVPASSYDVIISRGGTARMLAAAVQKERPEAALVCGRSGFSPRTHSEIGISSIRLGSGTGIHEVLISTGAETLSLKHEAHDRRLFAEGALRAAVFLCGRQPGLYDMDDLLKGDAL